MIPSSSPYIRNYLANKAELPGLGKHHPYRPVENKTGDIYDPQFLDTLRNSTTRSTSSPARTGHG